MLNCPFCNKPPALIKSYKRIPSRKGTEVIPRYQYRCLRCGVETPLKYRTVEDAERNWNFHADAKCFDVTFSNGQNISYQIGLGNIQHTLLGE